MRVCRNVTFQHAKRPMKDDMANQRLGPVNQPSKNNHRGFTEDLQDLYFSLFEAFEALGGAWFVT